jgi:hypothetical protein
MDGAGVAVMIDAKVYRKHAQCSNCGRHLAWRVRRADGSQMMFIAPGWRKGPLTPYGTDHILTRNWNRHDQGLPVLRQSPGASVNIGDTVFQCGCGELVRLSIAAAQRDPRAED